MLLFFPFISCSIPLRPIYVFYLLILRACPSRFKIWETSFPSNYFHLVSKTLACCCKIGRLRAYVQYPFSVVSLYGVAFNVSFTTPYFFFFFFFAWMGVEEEGASVLSYLCIQPFRATRMWHKVRFNWSLIVVNLNLSFSKTGYQTKVIGLSQFYYWPINRVGGIIRFIPFRKV